MKCLRCKSKNVIEILDKLGRKIVFCKDCFFAIRKEIFEEIVQKKLSDYYNLFEILSSISLKNSFIFNSL
mgnify:FL=1